MPFCFFGLGELFVPSDGSGLVEQVGGRGLSLEVSAEVPPKTLRDEGVMEPEALAWFRAVCSHGPLSSVLLRTALTPISAFTH